MDETQYNGPAEPEIAPRPRPPDAPPIVTNERPFTPEEAAAWRQRSTPPPPFLTSQLGIKGIVFALIALFAVVACYFDPSKSVASVALAVLFAVYGAVNAQECFYEVSEINSPAFSARRERNRAILDDGYAIEETYAPRRVITIDGNLGFDVYPIQLYELDDMLLLYCPPDSFEYGIVEEDCDDYSCWPNTYFSVNYSRLHRKFMSVTRHGDYMDPERLVDATDKSVIDDAKFTAFLQSDDCDPDDFRILNTTIDDLLASFASSPGK